MQIWVIYDKPKDFPTLAVARLWINDRPTSKYLTAPTVAELGPLLPPGLAFINRSPCDDPCIVGTFV